MFHQRIIAPGKITHETFGRRGDQKIEIDHPGQGEGSIGGIQGFPQQSPGFTLFDRFPENVENTLHG